MIHQDTHKRHDALVRDPICGMELYASQAFVRHQHGKMNYFCCPECKKIFEALAKTKPPGIEHIEMSCVARGDSVVSF